MLTTLQDLVYEYGTKEHEEELARLYDDSRMLRALEQAGVDNWEGFDDARELLQEQP